MKEFNLYGKAREISTKGYLTSLRNKGLIPAVIYGQNGNVNFYCFINDLKNLIYTSEVYQVNIKVDKKTYKTIVKDIQYHPVKDIPIHLDFFEITPETVIKMAYPVKFKGIPEGTKEGAKIFKKMRNLHIKGKVSDLPDELHLDITRLKVGDSMHVSEVSLPNLEILDLPSNTIVNVSMVRIIEEVAETAETAAAGTPAAGATPAGTTATPAADAPKSKSK
jgi:large subunit ribosomal protein L25